jgi:hypothetical protein
MPITEEMRAIATKMRLPNPDIIEHLQQEEPESYIFLRDQLARRAIDNPLPLL